MPTVSAIITGYNYARFLPGAIESVLGQTRVLDEIIVVDDGSTDNTAEVVERYADRGVRYIFKEKSSVSATRNTGIRASSGDLIACLDGDDRWLPDKIALQLAHMERYPSVGIVTGSECQVYESGRAPYYLHRKPVGSASFYPWPIIVENTIGNPSLTLIKRECFDKGGLFDETQGLGQDWEMWIRIARSFPVGVVDATLIHFTRHEASYTAGATTPRYVTNKQIRRRYIRQVPSRWLRLRLMLASESMNLYYKAASLADTPSVGNRALGPAIGAALLDPTYETRNKAGLLVRAALGPSALNFLKRFLPTRAGASVPDCGPVPNP